MTSSFNHESLVAMTKSKMIPAHLTTISQQEDYKGETTWTIIIKATKPNQQGKYRYTTTVLKGTREDALDKAANAFIQAFKVNTLHKYRLDNKTAYI